MTNRSRPNPTAPATPLVSVLIPVRNEASHLAEALACVRAQTVKSAEFLFIDGRSTDQTRSIVLEAGRGDPRVRLLANEAMRTPHGLNVGLRAARGEFVARMDGHTVYPPRYLADGIARLGLDDVRWVIGAAIPEGHGRWSRRVALALSCRLGVGGATFRLAQSREIDVDAGFSGVWRRDFLERIGGWDEEWPINQDGEMAGRVRKLGGRIVCVPSMAARYTPRNSLRGLASQYFKYGQYKAKTCHRHPASMRRSHVLPPAVVITAGLAMTPTRLGPPARLGLLTYAAAVLRAAHASTPDFPVADRLGVGAALTTMHTTWGAGFIVGCARFGFPGRALAGLVRDVLPKPSGPSTPMEGTARI